MERHLELKERIGQIEDEFMESGKEMKMMENYRKMNSISMKITPENA